MDALDISRKRILKRCIACGACTRACPSARNGGFVPDEFIRDLNRDRFTGDVWKCLQCYRCLHVCRLGINVPATVMDVRKDMALRGDAPEKIPLAVDAAVTNGTPFAPSPRVAKQRKELNLGEWDPKGGGQ